MDAIEASRALHWSGSRECDGETKCDKFSTTGKSPIPVKPSIQKYSALQKSKSSA